MQKKTWFPKLFISSKNIAALACSRRLFKLPELPQLTPCYWSFFRLVPYWSPYQPSKYGSFEHLMLSPKLSYQSVPIGIHCSVTKCSRTCGTAWLWIWTGRSSVAMMLLTHPWCRYLEKTFFRYYRWPNLGEPLFWTLAAVPVLYLWTSWASFRKWPRNSAKSPTFVWFTSRKHIPQTDGLWRYVLAVVFDAKTEPCPIAFQEFQHRFSWTLSGTVS